MELSGGWNEILRTDIEILPLFIAVILLFFFIASGLTACSGRSVENAGQWAAGGTITAQEDQAEERIYSALQSLIDFRGEYNLLRTCF